MSVTDLQVQTKEVVKKHVGAIHIKNDSSCLQRKLYDVLLFNAYDELPDFTVLAHSIALKELIRLVGFNSKNIDYLRASLAAMVTTPLEWNIIDENGHVEWGVSGALADADIVNGVCTYSYSRKLRKKLWRPNVYANIDLAVNRRFGTGKLGSSGSGFPLYQNIVPYRDVRQTPFFPLPLLKDLIGVGGNSSYDDYKIFNRAVIKPAIKEINAVSDIVVTAKPQRDGLRIVGLKFLIQEQHLTTNAADEENAISAPDSGSGIATNAEFIRDGLKEKLQTYYQLTANQANILLADFPIERVQLAMEYVEQQYKKGKVKRIAPYFLKVIKDGDLQVRQSAFDLEAAAAAEEKEVAAAKITKDLELRDSFLGERRRQIESYFAGLPAEKRNEVVAHFARDLAQKNKLIYSKYINSGMNLENKLVAAELVRYIENEMISKKLLLESDAAYIQFAALKPPE